MRILGTLAAIFLAVASPAQAQMCGGSYIDYIVRDANGLPLDAAQKTFSFVAGVEKSRWSLGDKTYGLFSNTELPVDTLTPLKGIVTPLRAAPPSPGFCVFSNPISMSVTMAGKTMDLLFKVGFPCCGSKYFLVDGLQFQEGSFEIDLGVDQRWSRFFPAKGWTKKTGG